MKFYRRNSVSSVSRVIGLYHIRINLISPLRPIIRLSAYSTQFIL
uniref:Uncharacterized protein n=1 Tax=Myoviridae sp. ctwwN25 TaxID=2825209 RepID=A0A8S5PP73_9CAUD|nr:MAG TPA: hypothetical protein [Myoviridae sp. ctwwN25]